MDADLVTDVAPNVLAEVEVAPKALAAGAAKPAEVVEAAPNAGAEVPNGFEEATAP